jgi:hypothetical protein
MTVPLPPQFTFGDIIAICKRLGLTKAKKGAMLWRGVGPDGTETKLLTSSAAIYLQPQNRDTPCSSQSMTL